MNNKQIKCTAGCCAADFVNFSVLGLTGGTGPNRMVGGVNRFRLKTVVVVPSDSSECRTSGDLGIVFALLLEEE